jgi:acetyltransferase-like isoleucine patch superfamily enzyme
MSTTALPEHARSFGDLPRWQLILMLGLNATPLVFVLLLFSIVFCIPASWPWRAGVAVTLLYLGPPLLARGLFAVWGKPEGNIRLGSTNYFVWWATLQLQMIFSRVPQSEEILRLVPGLYSSWLRLWGSEIGALAYWAPGFSISDRSYLRLGDHVVFGASVYVSPHVLNRTSDQRWELVIGTVIIGHRSLVGARSVLAAGAVLSPDESTRAFFIAPPFSRWQGGVRVRDRDEARGTVDV